MMLGVVVGRGAHEGHFIKTLRSVRQVEGCCACSPTRLLRRLRTLCLPLVMLFLGCSDVKGIDNKKAYGPLVSMIDLFTSCQLLETSAGPVLFDACWRKDELAARLREQGHAPQDVIAVLLTHGHPDHVGGLESLSSARLLALPEEQELITRNAKGDPTIDEALTDGQVLRFGATDVRVYGVPGHTRGSAAFLVDGALVVGDSGLITSAGAFTHVPDDRSEDPAQVKSSVVALTDRLTAEGQDVRWIVPAHSGGVEGRAALDAFVAANR
jgi:glyoxylase-like metal-dependent hydrolase (beta-lactamase superfamily II)